MPGPTYAVRNFTDERREELAWQAHERLDVRLPHLQAWNYDLCRQHRNGWQETYWDAEAQVERKRVVRNRPNPNCRKCAIWPRKHQRVSILWLYLKKKALLADTMGTGKTTSAGGLIALMYETGELSYARNPRVGAMGRVIIVPRSPALSQWNDELLRMMPGLQIITAAGGMTKANRQAMYLTQWQVLLIGPEMFRNDQEVLGRLPLAGLITDDIDPLRNPDTDTSVALDNLGRRLDRYVIMSGTPLQKRLMELHSILDGIGGDRPEILGPRTTFERVHVRYDSEKKVIGYRRLDEVKHRMAPLVLRRTAGDLDDVHIPAITPDDVMLHLYRAQRLKYEELRQGVIRLLREDGVEKTKRVTALSKIHYGAAICAGLAALGEEDGPGTSVKLDWIIDKVRPDGDLGEEKIVIYARLKNTVRALQYRLRDERIGFVTVWGEERRADKRKAAQDRFWDDPRCRILLDTSSIEQSLNLQVSRHLINVDMIMNPARMEQLAGRIRRVGSGFQRVFVHNLLTVNTQEERYLPLLEREAAIAGHIWDENSDLFHSLDPIELLRLIAA